MFNIGTIRTDIDGTNRTVITGTVRPFLLALLDPWYPDAGFDSQKFRDKCEQNGIIPNVDLNKRSAEKDHDHLLDTELYKERYAIERTNAWMDSFRSILNRFDFTVSSWLGFNYIAFLIIAIKKIKT